MNEYSVTMQTGPDSWKSIRVDAWNQKDAINAATTNNQGVVTAVDLTITCECGRKVSICGFTNTCDCGATFGSRGERLNNWWNQREQFGMEY